jgi:hypothetical protein
LASLGLCSMELVSLILNCRLLTRMEVAETQIQTLSRLSRNVTESELERKLIRKVVIRLQRVRRPERLKSQGSGGG